MSASCSIAPESRRSDRSGRLSWRASTARLSCAMARTGTLRSREYFESAADLGDLLLAVLRAVALPNHELQVIDDYERERQFTGDVELAGETPDLGPDLHQRDASCVVDPDRGPADFSHSPHQLRPVLGLDVAAPQSLSGDARGLRDKPLHELLLAHLQGEDGNRHLLLARSVPDRIESHGGFAHRRPRGEYDQVALVEACGEAV